MTKPTTERRALQTSAGEIPLAECRLAVGGRAWSVLHAAAVFARADEDRFLSDPSNPLPYGAVLWPAGVALAHEVATRATEFAGRTVLELGAGTGLPGIVAASLGAAVTQTDRQELALHLCKLNGEHNGVSGIEYRLADWAEWAVEARFDWVIGADVLYSDTFHEPLRRIFETALMPGGRVLVADPFRASGRPLLTALEASGWRAAHARWSIGDGADARPVAVYELAPPVRAAAPGGE